MSNQRVVVLTDEELRHGEAFVRAAASVEAEPSTREALEHTPVGSFIRKLSAALEHSEGITEWRWFAGDEGDSKYKLGHGEPRRSREEAEADLASVVAEADPPFDHQGIESRQCGPWIVVSGDEQ